MKIYFLFAVSIEVNNLEIFYPPQSAEVEETTIVELQCVFTGIYNTDIIWRKDDGPVLPHVTVSITRAPINKTSNFVREFIIIDEVLSILVVHTTFTCTKTVF